jgi:hypothetical protein
MEHERRHRQLHEPGLRNRHVEADPECRFPQPPVVAAGGHMDAIERLRRAIQYRCVGCGMALMEFERDNLTCTVCEREHDVQRG